MFGIGPMELVVISIVALVVVGPQRLPLMMKQLGKFFVYARRYSSDIRNEFNQVIKDAETEIRIDEAAKLRDEIRRELAGAASSMDPKTIEELGVPPQSNQHSPEQIRSKSSFDSHDQNLHNEKDPNSNSSK